MNKKNIILILTGLVILLGITTIYFYFSGKEVVSTNPSEQLDCETIESIYIRDACYVDIAVKEENHEVCKNVENTDDKDLCYIKIARMLKNNTICDNIVDKKYSRPKCYGEVTIALNN